MLSEFRCIDNDSDILLGYFLEFMDDAGVNPDIVIDVLEREQFGKNGKEAALSIKVNLGY